MERQEVLRQLEFLLELGVFALQLGDSLGLRVAGRGSTTRTTLDPLLAVQIQLLALGGEKRTVDTLPTHEGTYLTTLLAGVGFANDAELLGGGEVTWSDLLGRRAGNDLGGGLGRQDGEGGGLGHAADPVLALGS